MFYDSLEKLKIFPNDTLIFPSIDNALHNYIFTKSLDPNNEFLEAKMKIAKSNIEKQQMNVPVSLFEEKLTNPFLRCNESYYKMLTGENDPVKVFTKLKKFKDGNFEL